MARRRRSRPGSRFSGGKTVGVQGSTVNSQFLETYLKDTIQIREYKTTEQHDLDLTAGRIDAIFAGPRRPEGHAGEARVRGHGHRRNGMRGGILGRGVERGHAQGRRPT